MKEKNISLGFVLAGLMNIIAILVFSKFFTNDIIPETDPNVMSNFGLLMIIVWGMAYISVSNSYKNVKWLVLVFAIEKLVYGIVWGIWISKNNVSQVFDKDVMAGLFYSVYGLNDLIFFVFFAYVFYKLIK